MKSYCLYLEEFNFYFEFLSCNCNKDFLIELLLTKNQWEYDPNIDEHKKELSQKSIEELLTPPIYEINDISTLPPSENSRAYITDSIEYLFNPDTNKVDKKRIWKFSPLFVTNDKLELVKRDKINIISNTAHQEKHKNFTFKLSNGKAVIVDCSPEHIGIYDTIVRIPQFGNPSNIVSIDIFTYGENGICKNIAISAEDFCKIQMFIKNRNHDLEHKKNIIIDAINNTKYASEILAIDWNFNIEQYKHMKELEKQYDYLKKLYYVS